jgi:hypothetical protein
MMIYKTQKLEFSTVIIRENDDGSTTSFGESLDNADYQAYLKWLAEGNTPLPADEGAI